VKPYFDDFGRCIPGKLNSPVHQKVRRYFQISRSPHDPKAVYAQTVKTWGQDKVKMSEEEFCLKIKNAIQGLEGNDSLGKILGGTFVPFLVPATGNVEDMGKEFESVWLPKVKQSFEGDDKQHSFTNHCKHGLSGTMELRPGSRQEVLLAKCRAKDVAGIFFPCLSEYSIPAALERIGQLPSEFILSGAIDTASALIGSPMLLINREQYAPMLWLSAYTNPDELVYHFEPYGYNMTFNRRPHFNNAAEYWWNGLSLVCE
jgi:hypothetical protein